MYVAVEDTTAEYHTLSPDNESHAGQHMRFDVDCYETSAVEVASAGTKVSLNSLFSVLVSLVSMDMISKVY